MQPQNEIYDERRVLELLKQGSEYAFTQIFDHYRGNVYTTAVKFLKNPVYAEEIVQDVFLKIWLKRQTLNEVFNFEGYLFLMTRNLIFDRIKKAALEIRNQNETAKNNIVTNDTDHLVQDNQYKKVLNKAIELLPAQRRQVYCLSRIEGLSREEIAEKLNISPLTVKTHMQKALHSIREYLKQYPDLFILLVIFT